MNQKAIILFFGIVSLFFPSAAFSQVVATVNDKKITLKEFKQRYKEVQDQTMNPPNKKDFIEDLVRYEIGLQEAKKRKITEDPIVQERIRQELYKAFIEKAIGDEVNKIKVTEKEMKAFYEKNPEIRSSHILIEVKPNATAKQRAIAKKRAQEIYSEVNKSKRPFEELVRLYSDDVFTKNRGGDVGWQTRLTLVPAYYQTLLKMKPNEVRGLIETDYGFHIVKLTGRRSYRQANKRQIRAAVFDQKRRSIFDRFFARLKKNYKIKVNKDLIE